MMEEEGVFGLRGLSRDGDGDGGWGMETGISKEEFNQHRICERASWKLTSLKILLRYFLKNPFERFYFKLHVYMCVRVWIHAFGCRYQQKPEESIGAPRAGVRASRETSGECSGN